MNKQAKILIILAVIIGVGSILFSLYSKKANTSFVDYKEPIMDAQTKTALESRLDTAKKQVSEINDQTSDVEKYNRYVAVAALYYDLGFYKESKEYFLKAVGIRPQEHTTWVYYSRLLSSAGDYKNATLAVDKALSLNPNDTEYWRWKIELEQNKKSSNDTIGSIFSNALTATNNHPDILTTYATWLESTGDLPRAKEYWQKAIEANPSGKATYEAEIKRIDALIKQLP